MLFKLENVSFQDILQYPSIEIEEGKVTFLVGPSGVGKTTLLRMCNRTLSPTEGAIYYKGTDICEISPLELRRDVLLLSQQIFLMDGSIEDNFKSLYDYRGENLPSKDRMKFFLNLCKVPFDLEQRCDNLSGGERQRVAMALQLSFLPKVWMLDEPTSALDSETAHKVLKNIIDFSKGNGIDIIAVSHSPLLVEEFGERKISLTPGKEGENGRTGH